MKSSKTGTRSSPYREFFREIFASLPGIRDPRYLQLSILFTYAIVAREFFHFERTHYTTLSCCLWALIVDFVLGAVFYKALRFSVSSLIIGLSSSLLIYSPTPWAYLAVTTLGVLSKALITYQGKHFYNPTNFGVVVVLQLAASSVTSYPVLFSGSMAASGVFSLLGLLTVIRARQVDVSMSWLSGFVLFALVRAGLGGTSPWIKILPILGPGFLLFTFHMISDPATVPKTRRLRIGFGFSVALIDAVFRHFEILNGAFYGLFFVSSLTPWIRQYESRLRARK